MGHTAALTASKTVSCKEICNTPSPNLQLGQRVVAHTQLRQRGKLQSNAMRLGQHLAEVEDVSLQLKRLQAGHCAVQGTG
jgi:hypothetical protein